MTKRHPLRIASWNIGRGTVKDARRIITDERPAAIALQEASDQRELVREICAEFGYLPNQPDAEPGQAATPLLHDPKQLRARAAFAELMVPGQRVGKGTGPDHMKPKWLIGDYFLHPASRRRVAIGSTHRVAGQTRHGDTVRDRVAREHAAEVRETFRDYKGIPIVAGDWNSWPTDDSLRPLRSHGWTSDQLTSQPASTHGHWAPDHVWWRHVRPNGERDDRIRYVGHRTIAGTHSDHRPLIVDFELTERAR